MPTFCYGWISPTRGLQTCGDAQDGDDRMIKLPALLNTLPLHRSWEQEPVPADMLVRQSLLQDIEMQLIAKMLENIDDSILNTCMDELRLLTCSVKDCFNLALVNTVLESNDTAAFTRRALKANKDKVMSFAKSIILNAEDEVKTGPLAPAASVSKQRE